VTTSAPHGLTGTAKVLIAGASGGNNASLFNKSFDLLATPAASGSTYTISVTGFTTGTTGNGLLPPTTPGYTVPQGGCSNSNGNPRYLFPGIITQTDNYTQTLVDTTTATVIEDTSFSNTQSVVKTTPYTLIETTVNGVVTQPGTPTAGTASFGSPTSLPSTANTSKNLGTQTVDTSAGVASDFAVVTTIKTSKCFTSLPGTNPAVASISSSSYVTPAPTYTPTTVQPNTPSAQPTPSNVIVSTTAEIEVVGSRSTVINITSTNGGSTDSLADVSFYYFNTDLRNKALWDNCTGSLGTDVCGSSASFPKQNMLTMTLGLGASGLLAYKKDYMTQQSAGSGDYYRIKNGLADWPIPANGKGPENIDDLWHAAINGTDFGTTAIPVANPNTQYFSASNAKDLVDSLTIALSNVTAMLGSSSAAATSTLQPVTGDNDVFVAKFTSVQWTGDVQRLSINPDTGVLSKTPTWSAADMLEKRDLAATPRKVLYARSGRSDLLEFSYGNLNTDNLSQYFDNFCKKKGAGGNSAPSQCALMVDQTAANTGSNLIAYLTGGKDDNYRARNSRLGDVVNGAPLFVGIPKFKYADSGYSTFVGSTRQGYCSSTSTAGSTTRQGTVYVGANDGMLHAFDRCDGSEKWAYIPKMVMPNMYTIADNAYINNHQFFVDGAPVSGDIFDGTSWKTILVGGLNAGGKGYYALDITDPANPKALWEFTDSNNANLGLTFGNPIITKRASDKKWVVVFSSGYNNAANGGDGNGHLLMVDANTGDLVLDMPTVDYTTPVVASGTPSGLAKLNAWVEEESDNTALRYYGGDLAGNVWRFDTEGLTAPKNKSFRLAQLQVSGTPQPVTTEPELAQVSFHGANYAVVYVGTGSYLGMTDLATNGTQTIYAIKDDLGLVSLGDVRAGKTLIAQTLTTNNAIRKATTNAVDWSTKNGWYVDMPSTGERVNVSMLIAYNVLSVASTVPSNSPCESGGTSWLYKLDIASGSAVSNATDNAAGLMLQEGTLIVGQTVVQLTNGDATTISTQSSGDLRSDSEKAPSMDSVLRRTSWRELAN
jgi:type IV pilus assembly protein PilY1